MATAVAHAGGHIALAAVIAQRAGLAVFPLRVPHHVCGIVHPVIPRTAGAGPAVTLVLRDL